MMATWWKKCRSIRCLFICLVWSHLRLLQTSPCEELQLTTTIVILELLLTVERTFYVDDSLKSLPSEATAITHVHDLQTLLSGGGFKLTKWISNSRSHRSHPCTQALCRVKEAWLLQEKVAFPTSAWNQILLPSTPAIHSHRYLLHNW